MTFYQKPSVNLRRLQGKKKKTCPFCTTKGLEINYKDEVLLNQYISGQAKIKKRRRTGLCATHQRELAVAIKRARHLGLMQYTKE